MSLSFSDLNTAQRCLKLYDYRVVRRLQRKARATTLQQGTIMHEMLMFGYLNLQRHLEWDLGFDEYCDTVYEADEILFVDEQVEYGAMVDECVVLVEGHFTDSPFKGWDILHVEEEFSVTIDGTVVTFTPDLVARDLFGKVWIIDHKSTSGGPEGGIPFATQQSLLYFAGVKAFYPEAVGFLFNYIRKKLPTQPRLNKTKNKESGLYHVNDLNRIDTTYEILQNFLSTEAPELLKHPAHHIRLMDLQEIGDRFYWQDRILANEHALKVIIDETAHVIYSLNMAVEDKAFPRNLQEDRGYLSCSKCAFNPLCSAELLDMDTRHVLEDYEERDEKNPYESKES